MRRLASIVSIVLAALLLLFVIADIGLRIAAQYYVGRSLQDSLDLSHRPDVKLGGFPFVFRLLSGDLPSVTVRADDVVTGGVRFQEVRLTLHQAKVATGEVLSGDKREVRAKDGSGTATLSAADATEALNDQGVPLTVRFEGGDAVISAPGLSGEVRASISLSGQKLVLRPVSESLQASFSLSLPEVVQGIKYTGVSIQGSAAMLSFTLTDPVFELFK
jgi:LmeA-like phospholipid-binding